jgi:hypothetical protein
MEERRFLVTYSFKVYNQGYSCFDNDEIVLNNEEISDERDIPTLLKSEIQKISQGNAYSDKTLINFWEIR